MDSAEIRTLTRLEQKHWWYAERRHLLRQAITPLTVGQALDVGAAGGGNTAVLKELGWQCTALEYNTDGAAIAAHRGLPTVQGSGTHLPFADNSFDLVTSLDVIEHIDDDDACVSEIRRVLRPGAHWFITVPADPNLWSAHDVAVGHVRRYTRESLTDLLKRHDFHLASLESWMVLLRPVVAMRRNHSSGSDLEEMHPIVNAGLRAIVAAERFLPVQRLDGVSLIAHVRKPF